MLKPYKVNKTEQIFSNKYFKLNKATFIDAHENESEYFYETNSDAIFVIGLDKERKNFILTQQYRLPISMIIIQIAGGSLDENETMEAGGRREFMEETGYDGGEMVYLGKTCINPVKADYWLHEYLMFNCEPKADPENNHNEETEVFLLPVNEAWDYIKENKILSCHTTSTIVKALLYLNIQPTND